MPDSPELVTRIQELESRFMEQQRLLDELSSVVFTQQRRIDELSQALQRVNQKVTAEPGLVEAEADDKPPHY